jgi:CTP synthase
MVERLKHPKQEVRIAAVGKYIQHEDAYKSINEAFVHAGIANDCKVRLTWVDSSQFEELVDPAEVLKDFDGVCVGRDSAPAASKERLKPSSTRANRRSPFSASASACRWP